jgi:hypothetical protein
MKLAHPMPRHVMLALGILLGTGQATAASAAQIVLTPGSVIGSNGSYDNGRSAGNIFDQQTGDVSDIGATGTYQYWINAEGGPAAAFITVDLGAAMTLGSFELFNTHNGGYGDRGTGDFTIVGGNSVTFDATSGYELSGPTTTLASGTLTAAPVSDPISGSTFASASNATFRYLAFLPTSEASVNPHCCSANEYGLAELRVFAGSPATPTGAVPEPTSWLMMIGGLVMVGAGLRQRTRRSTLRYLAA